jgi:TnpA family transposase
LVRLAASLKDRLTPAHVVMQRLANANASDRLAGALSQLGRLMKTLHILRYIQEEPLRDAIQLQLNRGEFRHILARSLFFANWGNFRSGDYEEVMNKASCLSCFPMPCWSGTPSTSAVSSISFVPPGTQ